MSIIATISGTTNLVATVSTNQTVISSVPSTWSEMVAEYGQGYPYAPLTGQTTSYRTGDDANIESTIFSPARDS